MGKEDKEIRLPSDTVFLKDKNLSDLLFGYFSAYSQRETSGSYSLTRNAGEIISDLDMSYPTYKKKIEALESAGYIKTVGKKVYVLYNSYENSCKLPKETIEILLKSKLNNIIKVFTILIIFHESRHGNWFTYKSLLSQIGYSKCPSTSANNNIKDILNYLEKEGLLKYEIEYYGDLGRKRFKITELKKNPKEKNKKVYWRWISQNINMTGIKKNSRIKYNENDMIFIVNNIGFPKEGTFGLPNENAESKYSKAVELALQYNLIEKVKIDN